MLKFNIKDYFKIPENEVAKRVVYKSDNVLFFILNIAKGGTLPAHTHLDTTLLFQVIEGEAIVITDGVRTPLNAGELMEVDGAESLQVENPGDSILRLSVTIAPIGSEGFAQDADI